MAKKLKTCPIVVAAGLALIFGYAIYAARGIPSLGIALPFGYEPSYTKQAGFIPKHPAGWVGGAPWTLDAGVL